MWICSRCLGVQMCSCPICVSPCTWNQIFISLYLPYVSTLLLCVQTRQHIQFHSLHIQRGFGIGCHTSIPTSNIMHIQTTALILIQDQFQNRADLLFPIQFNSMAEYIHPNFSASLFSLPRLGHLYAAGLLLWSQPTPSASPTTSYRRDPESVQFVSQGDEAGGCVSDGCRPRELGVSGRTVRIGSSFLTRI